MLLDLPVHDAIRGQPEKRQAHAEGSLDPSFVALIAQTGLRVQDIALFDSAGLCK